jgi:hypothetical protein
LAVQSHYFVLTGSLCLIVALIQAWLLVAVFSSETSPVSRIIPGRQDLLKSHIDYLMMTQFLFIFFMLYRALGLTPPGWVVVCVCVGSFFNPFAFFVRAIKPSYLKDAPIAFVAMITISCILTTVGYGASAWLFARAVLGLS